MSDFQTTITILVGIVMILSNFAALIWAASTIKGSTDHLKEIVKELRADVVGLDTRLDGHEVRLSVIEAKKTPPWDQMEGTA